MILAYAGEPGSYSHLACQSALFRDSQAVAYPSFSAALSAVAAGRADQAMIPIENPVGGRVAAVHALLRCCELAIVAEHFQPVKHCLLGCGGATLKSIKQVISHRQALDQCHRFLSRLALQRVETSDTASAAREVAKARCATTAAIASSVAASIYGLRVLCADIQDLADNTTRFVVFARQPLTPLGSPREGWITACLLHLANRAAALSEALACIVTNGLWIIKCETYMSDAGFHIDAVYLEFIGHPQHAAATAALVMLREQCVGLRIFGAFRASRSMAK